MYTFKLDDSSITVWDEINLPVENKLNEGDMLNNMSLVVKFDVEIGSRSWGIEELTPRIISLDFNCEVERYDDTTDETSYEDIEINLDDYIKEIHNGSGNGGYPTDAEINFAQKKITLTF